MLNISSGMNCKDQARAPLAVGSLSLNCVIIGIQSELSIFIIVVCFCCESV
jgi:hypothetical protein